MPSRRTLLGITDAHPTYSFAIPVYDEEENLDALFERVTAVMDDLDGPAEVVLVDDGSSDRSWEGMVALSERDPRWRAIRLSRNFGHQVALSAGIEHARGEAVILMDADLQDPPEVVPDLARAWRAGSDVVYAVRSERQGESRAKLATARWFYRLLSRMTDIDIPLDTGDFRLVDRRVVESVVGMPERSRYLRGMFAWVGFDQTGVTYERHARHRGTTKFSFSKMIAFAADGIVSFSSAPLRLVLSLGFFVSAVSFLTGLIALVAKVAGAFTAPGWASIVVPLSFLGGVQLVVLGLIGEYVAHIHEEVKRRPLYLLRDQIGFDAASTETSRAISAES